MNESYTGEKNSPKKQNLINRLYNVYKAFKGRDLGLKPKFGGYETSFVGTQKASASQDRFNREFYEPTERRNLIAQINTLLADHPILEAALLIFAGGAVSAGFNAQIISASSASELKKAQRVIDRIKKLAKLETILPSIAVQLPTYGDTFVQPILDELTKTEIVGVKVMPVASMERLTDDKEDWINPDRAFVQKDVADLKIEGYMGIGQIIHARHLHVPGHRYGRSRIFATRGVAKDAIDAIRSLLPRRLANQPFRWYNLLGNDDEPLTEAQFTEFQKNTSRRIAFEEGRGYSPFDDLYTNKVQLKVLGGDPDLGTMTDIEMLIDASLSSIGVSRQIIGWGTNVNRDVLDEQRDQLYAAQQQFAKEITEQILIPLFETGLLLAKIDPDSIKIQIEYNQQFTDRQMEARMENARKDFVAGGISRKTYVKTVSNYYLIEDIEGELKLIKQDRDEDKPTVEGLKQAKQANNRQLHVPTASPNTEKGFKRAAAKGGKQPLLQAPKNKKQKIDPFGRGNSKKVTKKESTQNGVKTSETRTTETSTE